MKKFDPKEDDKLTDDELGQLVVDASEAEPEDVDGKSAFFEKYKNEKDPLGDE